MYTYLNNLWDRFIKVPTEVYSTPHAYKLSRRLSLFLIIGIFGCAINLVAYLAVGLYVSAAIIAFYLVCLILSLQLTKKGYYNLILVIAVLSTNACFIIINYADGLKAGKYLLYFPIMVAFSFMTPNRKFNLANILFYGLTFLSIIWILSFIEYNKSPWQTISLDVYINMYNFNLIGSLLLGLAFTFITSKVNEENEESLREEKLFFDTIYHSSLDAVVILDKNNIIINSNQQAKSLLSHINNGEINGSSITSLIGNHAFKKTITRKKIDDSKFKGWEGEFEFLLPNEQPLIIKVNSIQFTYNKHDYRKLSIADITEAKQNERELVNAKERAETAALVKTRFLSNMSHELRTPLNGIIGTSNLLIAEEHLAHQESHLEILKYSSKQMMSLINDILDLNKIEAGKMMLDNSSFSLQELVNRIIMAFTPDFKKKGIQLVNNFDDKANLNIISDSVRLNQVLSNLLSNALKFTSEGTVTITTKVTACLNGTAAIYLEVRDTGIGIASEKLEYIFESFTQADVDTTRKYGGTGLGLSISKKIINMFNSELKAESELGKGSAFSFYIYPEVDHQFKEQTEEVKIAELPAFENLHVLLAEDNPVNMIVAKRFLQRWNIQITEAGNGKQAAEKFPANGSVDLLLLDLEMPEMDGYQALAEIRKTHPHIPAIAFTAAVFENMEQHLQENGFTDYIQKPFKPEDLHQKIKSLTTAATKENVRA
jgi:PAS domain S-box-containing protein